MLKRVLTRKRKRVRAARRAVRMNFPLFYSRQYLLGSDLYKRNDSGRIIPRSSLPLWYHFVQADDALRSSILRINVMRRQWQKRRGVGRHVRGKHIGQA